MYANLCPGTVGIARLPSDQLIALAARHGFGGVDLPLDQLADASAARDAAQQAQALGLRWGLFWLPFNPLGAEGDYAPGMARLRSLLPLIQAAGCTRTYLHVLPGHEVLAAADNHVRHVERLRPLLALLRDHGVSLGLEFIGPATKRAGYAHPFVHSLAGILPLIEELGTGAGVVLDTFHWWTSGGTVEELRRLLPGHAIINVHLNDARAGRSREEQQDHERELPLASGLIDVGGMLRVLAELAYEGPLIIEPFSPQRQRLAALPPEAVAGEIAALFRRLFAESGLTEPGRTNLNLHA